MSVFDMIEFDPETQKAREQLRKWREEERTKKDPPKPQGLDDGGWGNPGSKRDW